jgi:hypothetical protein
MFLLILGQIQILLLKKYLMNGELKLKNQQKVINGIKKPLFQKQFLKPQMWQILGLKFPTQSLLKEIAGIKKHRKQLHLYLVNGVPQLRLNLPKLMLGELIKSLLLLQAVNGVKMRSKLLLALGAKNLKVKRKKKQSKSSLLATESLTILKVLVLTKSVCQTFLHQSSFTLVKNKLKMLK